MEHDGDAGGEIEKRVAVDVFDHRAAAASSRPADNRACTKAKERCGRARPSSFALGPGRARDQMRQISIPAICIVLNDLHRFLREWNFDSERRTGYRRHASRRIELEEKDLIYAEEVRALMGGLAMQRHGRVFEEMSFVFPANPAVFRIFKNDTRIGELLADFVGMLEIAASFSRRCALRSGPRLGFGGHARLAAARSRACASLSSSSSIKHREDRVEFFHGGDQRGARPAAGIRRGPWRC